MQKTLALLVSFCLLYNAYTQSVCIDGYIEAAGGADANKAKCVACAAICKTCATNNRISCTAYSDKLKGLANGTPICPFNILNAIQGYNAQKDSCDVCADGCVYCYVDYNVCDTCQQGWDLDKANYRCIRATLGLAAVVLALSVLILLVGVISCICACKL